MTDHNNLKMIREERRIQDTKLISAVLDMTNVCTVALHDEPYPYIVPMNYGYVWEEDRLTLYLHMAVQGHRINLIKENPNVACNIQVFLDRFGTKKYRGEGHDYRSVTVYGKAEILQPEEPEEFMKALRALCASTGRPRPSKIPKSKGLYMMRIRADIVTAKSQYEITSPEEISMPVLIPK